ncbi:MAG TPA: class I SAM-dependent methyltransferase [Chloroflexota bacterium]|nr:class I SAM-dependent methyltransferase [Chloroflexota bacterium]
MHADAIVEEFARQSAAFNVSPVFRSAETLTTLIELIPADPRQRWLEVCCGPGIISRALAPRVGEVHGVDLTPTMVELATAEARRESLGNVSFSVGDATNLPVASGSYDGAVTRFSLHHIPDPGRCVSEMARVVRPGGLVVVGDHITSDDVDTRQWHQEMERLRDPSHWMSLSPRQLRALGEAAGLAMREEKIIRFSLDFDEWLTRGTGGRQNESVIGGLLGQRSEGDAVFRVVVDSDGTRTLHLIYWLSLWQRE